MSKVIIKENGIENVDYVICKICGAKYNKLTTSHLKIHNLTLNEYKKLYPNVRTCTSNVSKKYADNGKISHKNKTKEERTAHSKYLASCWWNKYNNMDEEDKLKYTNKLSTNVAKGIKNNKEIHPKEYAKINKKRSETRKKLYKDNKTKEIMRSISKKGCNSLWNSLSADEKIIKMNHMRKANKKRWDNLNIEEKKIILKNNFSSKKIKYIIGENVYYFRSKFESVVAKYLYSKQIKFEYENIIIQLDNNKVHLIDFNITDTKYILECKSLYKRNTTEQAVLEEVNNKKEQAEKQGYKYFIIWYDKIDKIYSQLDVIIKNL